MLVHDIACRCDMNWMGSKDVHKQLVQVSLRDQCCPTKQAVTGNGYFLMMGKRTIFYNNVIDSHKV